MVISGILFLIRKARVFRRSPSFERDTSHVRLTGNKIVIAGCPAYLCIYLGAFCR